MSGSCRFDPCGLFWIVSRSVLNHRSHIRRRAAHGQIWVLSMEIEGSGWLGEIYTGVVSVSSIK